jgi:hypothetical protein
VSIHAVAAPYTAGLAPLGWVRAHLIVTVLAAVAIGAWCIQLRGRRPPRARRRPPVAVVVAALAAAACTAYSADTSWRFARDRLGMSDPSERAWMFAAGELALFACALMARQNLRTSGAPGVPGALVWVIATVQIIPAYAESGVIGGTVRAFFGSVLSALLWHLAMGIELRHAKPGANSQSLPAVLAREVRERLLSRLGLAVRGRDAAQLTRDRATARAVALATRLAAADPSSRAARRLEGRLAAAVARAEVGSNPAQRARLLGQLAARRGAAELATMHLDSPWTAPAPETAPGQPRTLTAVVAAELAGMHPVDAVHQVRQVHPAASAAELACLLTAHGVVASETQVRIAMREQPGGATPTPAAPAADRPRPHPADAHPAPGGSAGPEASPHGRCRRGGPQPDAPDLAAAEPSGAPAPAPLAPDAPGDDDPDDPEVAALLPRARELDAASRRQRRGKPVGLRTLQRELRIGQARAQQIQRALAKAGDRAAGSSARPATVHPSDHRLAGAPR